MVSEVCGLTTFIHHRPRRAPPHQPTQLLPMDSEMLCVYEAIISISCVITLAMVHVSSVAPQTQMVVLGWVHALGRE